MRNRWPKGLRIRLCREAKLGKELIGRFLLNEYGDSYFNFISSIKIQRAANIPRRLALQTNDMNKSTRVPFITTFNPSLSHISNIIKKHYHLLFSSGRCKKVFPNLPVWPSDDPLTYVAYWFRLNFLLTRLIPTHNSLPAAIVAVKIAPLAHTFPMVSLTTPSFPLEKHVLSNLT